MSVLVYAVLALPLVVLAAFVALVAVEVRALRRREAQLREERERLRGRRRVEPMLRRRGERGYQRRTK